MEIATTMRAASGGAPASRGSGAAPAPFGGAAAARAEFFEALRADFTDAPAAHVAAHARGTRFRGVTKHKRTQRYEVRALPMPVPPVAAAGRRPPSRPPPFVQISLSAENLAHILNLPFRPPSSHHPPTAPQAHIWQAKKQIYLGGFDSEVLAAKSHDLMALRCRGSAAAADALNFAPAAYAALAPLLGRLPVDDVVAALRSFSKAQTAARAGNGGAPASPGACGVAKPRAPRRPALAPRRAAPPPPRRRRPAYDSGEDEPSVGGSEGSDSEDEWARGLVACAARRTGPRGAPRPGGGQGLCAPRLAPAASPAAPAPWGAPPALRPLRGLTAGAGAGFGALARSPRAPPPPALAALDAFDLDEAFMQLAEEPVRAAARLCPRIASPAALYFRSLHAVPLESISARSRPPSRPSPALSLPAAQSLTFSSAEGCYLFQAVPCDGGHVALEHLSGGALLRAASPRGGSAEPGSPAAWSPPPEGLLGPGLASPFAPGE
jgi:hypothetical protein